MLDPARLAGCPLAPGAHRVADLLLLPDDQLRREVVDDERELVGLLAPVRRAEHRAELGAGQQQLLDAEAVLPEPQDAVTASDANSCERVRGTIHAFVERAPIEVHIAVRDRERVGA